MIVVSNNCIFNGTYIVTFFIVIFDYLTPEYVFHKKSAQSLRIKAEEKCKETEILYI